MRNLESILNEVAKIVSLRHHLSSVFMEAQFFSAAFSNFLYGIGVKAVQELKKSIFKLSLYHFMECKVGRFHAVHSA